MPWTCFSYPADVPSDSSDHRGAQPASSCSRQMTSSTCFRYQTGADLGDLPPAQPGSRRITNTTCFRY